MPQSLRQHPTGRARRRRALAFAIVLTALSIGWWQRDYLRGYSETSSSDLDAVLAAHPEPQAIGMLRFMYDALGGLNTDALQTHATPWKVMSTALVLAAAQRDGRIIEELSLDDLNAILQEFGFIVPEAIANWDGDVEPLPFRRPLGIHSGLLTRSLPRLELEVTNLGCPACHAGVTYRPDGTPTRTVWLGLPNTSINLDAFTIAAYQGLKLAVRTPARLMAGIRHLYPNATPRELQTIEGTILPLIEERIGELERTIDAPAPYSNGSPGLTNGVGGLKWALGMLEGDARDVEVGFTSIPELGGTLLRTSLLYDGVYAVPGKPRFAPMDSGLVSEQHLRDLAGIVSFFTVPIMGVTPAIAERSIPNITDIMRFVASYRSPPFPGAIDSGLASQGRAVYQVQCASCHGSYSPGLTDVRLIRFPNRHVPQGDMGTDSARWQPDSALFPVLMATEFADHIDMASTYGYVATPLTGLWATAPYLHNGSIPTLWHLMHPEGRPERFYVGGHRLDFSRVGIDGVADSAGVYRYPTGYQPWSRPHLYDTRRPGLRNTGHDREFAPLTEAQKAALLEYLKLL